MTDFSEVIEQLQTLIPSYAEVSIERFVQPTCTTATYTKAIPVYYQISLCVPLKKGSKLTRPNNAFSLTRRVESIDRTMDAWSLTITAMLSEESEQRSFINRRIQQARRQEWLYGGDVRIDGKPSNQDRVPPRQRGFIF